jgi:ATP-binding cassette subfamily B protein
VAVTFFLDPALSLVIIGAIPVLAAVVAVVSRQGMKRYNSAQGALDRMTRKAQEFMVGVRVIKALSKEEYEREQFAARNGEVTRQEERASGLMALTSPIMNFILNGGLTLVIVLGAVRVNAGLLKPGVIVAFLSYFAIILESIMMAARMFSVLSRGAASAGRIEEVLLAPEDLGTGDPDREESPCHITFRHVSFSYGGDREALSGVTFSLRRGETLGIIGPAGSGKTTILKLLLRLYDAGSGEIRINGERISGIPPERLYSMFGVVFQNDFLFAGTLRENIAFGREIPVNRIREALESAQGDFALEKKGGLCYRLPARGASLSGGQKQRLLIARALAGDPEILLLDDASSALDYRTDAALRGALRRDFSGVTTIIAAQRVSSVIRADLILVLENGKVAAAGTHGELLASSESYREIYQMQMGEIPA